jgi:hypothetical protein
MRLNDVLRNEAMVEHIFSDEELRGHWTAGDASTMLKQLGQVKTHEDTQEESKTEVPTQIAFDV